MAQLSPYAQYRDEFWSSVDDHQSGACLTRFCLYCASIGVSLAAQEHDRHLSDAHRAALEESRTAN